MKWFFDATMTIVYSVQRHAGGVSRSRLFASVILCLLFPVCRVSFGAIMYLEDFNPNANGWTARDSFMTVSGTGNELQGVFSDQGIFSSPETDAFRISTGSDFLGSYLTGTLDHPLTQIRFDLEAVNVLPSDLFIRIFDGANVFSYQFNPINFSDTYVVNLAWSFGWNGLSENAFNTALTSIDWIEIQVSRNGSSSQSYLLDNAETLNTDIGDPGGSGSAVPEPTTVSLFLVSVAVLGIYRRSSSGKAASQ